MITDHGLFFLGVLLIFQLTVSIGISSGFYTHFTLLSKLDIVREHFVFADSRVHHFRLFDRCSKSETDRASKSLNRSFMYAIYDTRPTAFFDVSRVY